MKAQQISGRIDMDCHEKSGQVVAFPSGEFQPELFIRFPGTRGCMWVRMDGSYVSGWTDHGAHFGRRYGFFDRLTIRRAVRDWFKRKESSS